MVKKVLFFQWNAFMQREIEECLVNKGIEYDIFYYIFKNWEKDDFFCGKLHDKLNGGGYDCVFSINYAPLVSRVCDSLGINYISWVYDCPLHIRDVSDMGLSCNRIFFFDRAQAMYYQAMFKDSGAVIRHLPLAVKPERIDTDSYDYDISLLGKLYKSDFNYLCTPLDSYYRGYMDGIVNAQLKLGSGYILDEMLTDTFVARLNEFYRSASIKSQGKEFTVKKEELEFTLATETTGRQRFMALALLQSRLNTALYSDDKDDRLSQVTYKGYVDYYEGMPYAFAKSRLNLNISLCSIKTGIPLRILDICKTGAAVITNAQPELFEYFVPDESIIIYEDIKDLVEKSMYYARHDSERRAIAARGYDVICEAFNYESRIGQLFA